MPSPRQSSWPIPRTWLALPGALGTPADWQSLSPRLGNIGSLVYWDWHTPPATRIDWPDLADAFAETLRDHPKPWGLLGYSQGGRAALAALARNPEMFAAACIISAHPGLDDAAARAARAIQDEQWAARAERDDWPAFLAAWDLRGALADGIPIETWDPALTTIWQQQKLALESARIEAAAALRKWSLARQPNLWPELPRITKPILWFTGGRDPKFLEIATLARSILHDENAVHAVIPEAGHRLPWQQPDEFANILCTWLGEKSRCVSIKHPQ